MALLPAKNGSTKDYTQTALDVLTDLKKGSGEKRNEFVWVHQERVYAVAYLGTDNHDHATEVTISAFNNAFSALNQSLPRNPDMSVWDWLSQFVVDAMGEYHAQNSDDPVNNDGPDPSQDGSANMDWETTVLLGVQRVKRCISSLSPEQKRAFLLRHHYDLNYEQIATVANETVESAMATLYRARVQVVKCLGRG